VDDTVREWMEIGGERVGQGGKKACDKIPLII